MPDMPVMHDYKMPRQCGMVQSERTAHDTLALANPHKNRAHYIHRMYPSISKNGANK